MITPAEIKQKAIKKYPAFLMALLTTEPFFPLHIPFRKPAASVDYMTLKAWVAQVRGGSKAEKGYGYTLHLQTRDTRRDGPQSLPRQISFDTATDFLKLIGKEKECHQFQTDVALIRERLPQLEDWLRRYPLRIVANAGQWPELMTVCEWFIQNPRSNLYIREIPVDVHTKFIEENQGILRLLLDELLPQDAVNHSESKFAQRYYLRFDEPLIRVRLLDPQLQEALKWPAGDLSLPRSKFAALGLAGKPILIAENKMTFLTLPSAPVVLPETIAIWGGGFRVTELGGVDWMKECAITYWGDLDVQGFEILSRVRTHFPQVESFLMDRKTLEAYAHFAVMGTTSRVQQLAHLAPEEEATWRQLQNSQQRLEQERIPLAYVVTQLLAHQTKGGKRANLSSV